jgi:hypothetical protein
MQYLALDHLSRSYNENQLKSNKEYGDGLYAVLALMRTDQDKECEIHILGRCSTTRRLPEQNGIVEN